MTKHQGEIFSVQGWKRRLLTKAVQSEHIIEVTSQAIQH
jgi:hypothetical protein